MKKVALFTIIAFLLLLGTAAYQYFTFNDGRLHVVFCDVGQGDAIFIRTPSGKNILIDGGPDRKVIGCLSEQMPFWERNIDIMVLTHPHADHFMGMFYVLERYNVTSFATEELENKSDSFQELIKLLKEEEVPVKYVLAGDRWVMPGGEVNRPTVTKPVSSKGNERRQTLNDTGIVTEKRKTDITLSILGPTKDFLEKTSPDGLIGDSKEFASLITHLSFGSFHVLFTGDTQAKELADSINGLDYKDNPIVMLQSPHHGSKTGLIQQIVQQIAPKAAIISVGQYNRYGHPNKAILELFQTENVPVFRTDESGTIEVVSDGTHAGTHIYKN